MNLLHTIQTLKISHSLIPKTRRSHLVTCNTTMFRFQLLNFGGSDWKTTWFIFMLIGNLVHLLWEFVFFFCRLVCWLTYTTANSSTLMANIRSLGAAHMITMLMVTSMLWTNQPTSDSKGKLHFQKLMVRTSFGKWNSSSNPSVSGAKT